MKKILFALPLGLLFVGTSLSAQKYSNEFLNIGVGGRALGMGTAQVATTNDVYSGYWNPAGLVNMQGDMLQVAFMHSEWFGQVANYDYASFSKNIMDGKRAIGASFIRFGIDNIPNTLSLYESDGTVNYDNISKFSAADYAMLFSYAQKVGDLPLRIGGNAKIIHRKVGPFANAWGFGLDIGAQYSLKDWRFGLTAKDITGTFNAWKFNFTPAEIQTLLATDNEIPLKSVEVTKPQIILGAGYAKDFTINKKAMAEGKKQQTIGVSAELDFQATTDGKRNALISGNPISVNPVVGMEMNYNKLVFLRSGINNIQQVKNFENVKEWSIQPNMGVGLKVWWFQIDYAISKGVASQQYTHVVSIRADLDMKVLKNVDKEKISFQGPDAGSDHPEVRF